jgi:hypothetical protein
VKARTELERMVLHMLRARKRRAIRLKDATRLVIEVYPPREGRRSARTRMWWDHNVKGWIER